MAYGGIENHIKNFPENENRVTNLSKPSLIWDKTAFKHLLSKFANLSEPGELTDQN